MNPGVPFPPTPEELRARSTSQHTVEQLQLWGTLLTDYVRGQPEQQVDKKRLQPFYQQNPSVPKGILNPIVENALFLDISMNIINYTPEIAANEIDSELYDWVSKLTKFVNLNNGKRVGMNLLHQFLSQNSIPEERLDEILKNAPELEKTVDEKHDTIIANRMYVTEEKRRSRSHTPPRKKSATQTSSRSLTPTKRESSTNSRSLSSL